MRILCAALATVAIVACSVDGAPPTMSADNVDTLTDGGSSDGTTLGDVALADGALDGSTRVDASDPADAATAVDASADTATSACGSVGADYQCTADGDGRQRCYDGAIDTQSCSRGCLHEAQVADDVCLGDPGTDTFSCNGTVGKLPSTDGDYYLSEFGCWADSSGGIHLDPGDDCIPDCLSQAITAGLCATGAEGPACEETIDYYVADDDRFGCLSRVRVSNPTTGVAVIAVVIDGGPLCSTEQSANGEVLNASGPVNNYLFGGYQGAEDHVTVHVVQVDPSTPLGPTP
jgi:hypothetical protein